MAVQGEIVRKRKMGRPSKISPELVRQAWDYINEKRTMTVNELLPTIEGLALAIGVHRDTLQEWEKSNSDFSVIMADMRSAQAEKLIQNALVGRYNPTIAKLLLSKHGYIEKTEQDTTVNVVQPLLGGISKDANALPADNDD